MLKMFKEVRLKLWEMTIKGTSFNDFTNFCVDNGIQYQFTTPTFLNKMGYLNGRIKLCLKLILACSTMQICESHMGAKLYY